MVKPQVASKWEELGTALQLGDDDDGLELDRIQEKRNGDPGLCFNDLMKLWLRSGTAQITWGALIKAVKGIDGLEAAGAQIEAQFYSSGK